MMDTSKCIDRFLEPQKTSYAIALEEAMAAYYGSSLEATENGFRIL